MMPSISKRYVQSFYNSFHTLPFHHASLIWPTWPDVSALSSILSVLCYGPRTLHKKKHLHPAKLSEPKLLKFALFSTEVAKYSESFKKEAIPFEKSSNVSRELLNITDLY